MRHSTFLFLILFFIPFYLKAWTGTSRVETDKEKNVILSVLQFTKKQQSVTYKPSAPPYGSISIEKVIFKNRSPFFLTGWAHGAQTMMFRVFDPEASGALPLCEVISFAESSELRILEEQLQIKVFQEEGKSESEWLNCGETERQPQSNKKKKSKKRK